MSTIEYCPKCRAEITAGSKFCSECGAKLNELPQMRFCSQCGKQCSPDSIFCANCGAKLITDADTWSSLGAPEDPIWDISASELQIQQDLHEKQLMANYDYTKEADGTYIVTRFKGKYETHADVPDRVKVIAEHAFEDTKLCKITLPDTLTFIGECAFRNCKYLETVNIPASVMTIEDEAFAGCEKLDIAIPRTVKNVGRDVLAETKAAHIAAERAAALEQERNRIRAMFAYDDKNLVKFENQEYAGVVTVPSDANGLMPHAFEKCEKLTGVIIPFIPDEISDWAFDGCISLESIVFNSPKRTSDANAKNNFNEAHLNIPINVFGIGKYAFRSCGRFAKVTIGDSVMQIGEAAFANCSNLRIVNIGQNVTEIGEFAFHNCAKIRNVTIPDSVTIIGNGAFRKCSGIESIIIPEGVRMIGNNAFHGCSLLNEVSLPRSLCQVGSRMFYNCGKLKKIRFWGTREQWRKLNIAISCNDAKIYCSDGNI